MVLVIIFVKESMCSCLNMKTGSNFPETVQTFGGKKRCQIQMAFLEEIKNRLKSENACYHSGSQNVLSKNTKNKIFIVASRMYCRQLKVVLCVIVVGLAVCIVVCVLCVLLSSYVYLLHCVCIAVFFTLDVGLLARSQYSEGPVTGHLGIGFSRFPSVYKQTLRRFPTFQVATTCFSCSAPDLILLERYFIICLVCIVASFKLSCL